MVWRPTGRTKYHAVPTVVDGMRFASKAEAARYRELMQLGAAGLVQNLEFQPRFDLHVEGVKVGTYVADFRYQERASATWASRFDWQDVIEDVKGVRTPVYRLKKRMFEAEYGVTIRETR
jgi:hypothetical protein